MFFLTNLLLVLLALLQILSTEAQQCLGSQLQWAGTCVNFCPAGTISDYSNGTVPCTPCPLNRWSRESGQSGQSWGLFSGNGGCTVCTSPNPAYAVTWVPGTRLFTATCSERWNGGTYEEYYAANPSANITCEAAAPPSYGYGSGGYFTGTPPACTLVPPGFDRSTDKTTFYPRYENFGNPPGSIWLKSPTQLVRVPNSLVDVLFVDAYLNKVLYYKIRDTSGSMTASIGHIAAGCTSTPNDCPPGYAGDGQLANSSTVQLDQPTSAAYDSLGNLFICDAGNRVIRKVDSAGIISTLPINASSGGLLRTPRTLAVDANNNLYIGDTTAFLIFKVTPGGAVTVIAGNGVLGQPSSDTAVLATSFSVYPYSIAYSSQANTLVILDPLHGKVRELNLVSGNIRTILGAGMTGPMNITTTAPTFKHPLGIPAMTAGLNSGWGALTFCNGINGLKVAPWSGSPFDYLPNGATGVWSGSYIHYCQYLGYISVSSTNTVYVSMRNWAMAFVPDGAITISSNVIGSSTYFNNIASRGIVADNDSGYFLFSFDDNNMEIDWQRKKTPAGYYSRTGWGTDSDALPCPRGYSSARGATVCTPCPIGTFAPSLGSTSCTPCPVNTYSSSIGQGLPCTPCEYGTVSVAGSFV